MTFRLLILGTPVLAAAASQQASDRDPRDTADAIRPAIATPPTFRYDRDGRDPASAAILAAIRR
jgi:hypothetical protein